MGQSLESFQRIIVPKSLVPGLEDKTGHKFGDSTIPHQLWFECFWNTRRQHHWPGWYCSVLKYHREYWLR